MVERGRVNVEALRRCVRQGGGEVRSWRMVHVQRVHQDQQLHWE